MFTINLDLSKCKRKDFDQSRREKILIEGKTTFYSETEGIFEMDHFRDESTPFFHINIQLHNLQLFIDDQNENNEKLVYMSIFSIFTFENHIYCAMFIS